MRILVVPDIHLKPGLILRAEEAAQNCHPEKVIFLGDYFDDWGTNLADYRDTITLLKHCEKNLGAKAVFLWGNHEYSYIAKRPCSGYNPYAATMVCIFLRKFPLQMAYQTDGYLFTHAGVTNAWYKKWMQNNKKPVQDDYIATDMNATFDSPLNPGDSMWFTAGASRGGNGTPSPLWADKEELIADPLVYPIVKTQVVGHTPQRKQDQVPVGGGGRLIFTDTFSNGNGGNELLLLDTEGDTFTLVKI